MDPILVLRLESRAVFRAEGGQVARRLAGKLVDGGVVNADLKFVLSGADVWRDVEPVGRVPERAGALAVDEDDGCFANGRVEQCVHAVGVGRAVVGDGVPSPKSSQ